MKSIRLFLLLVLPLLAAFALHAADDPAPGDPAGFDVLPALVLSLTPLVIAGAKALAPRIPKGIIPFLAPPLGVLIDWVAHLGSVHDSNAMVGALLGMAGVGLREMVDRLKKAGATPQAMVAMLLLLTLFTGTGCTSIEKALNSMPQVSAQELHLSTNNTLGGVQIDAENLRQTPTQATADALAVTISAPFVGTTTVVMRGYVRDKRQPLTETAD